ncbi:MAG: SprT-like domain-containing protein, partial [Chthoniobacteraceae bacterium]
AHEYDGGMRRWNAAPYAEWVTRLAAGLDPLEGSEVLTKENREAEAVYLGLRTTAGLAYPARQLIMLNPKVHAFEGELERTMRHELAHLLAHHRAGKRRIAAHGPEWRQACAALGIAEEPRCHKLPLPKRTQHRKHIYACPSCKCIIRRVRPIRKKSACLACCRAHNRGQYDERFRLRRITE